jgi:hypothetical protein
VSPSSLATLRVACDADMCTVDGKRVSTVVFRARPSLMVAPGFTESDASFAAAELRATWAHILSMPGMVAVNRATADSWFSGSEWAVWRRRLQARGVLMAPRNIGRPYADGWWVRWTGGQERAPDAPVAERLGTATIERGTLTRALCCAGEVWSEAEGAAPLGVARALLEEGLVLSEVVLDESGRLVGLETTPAVAPAQARDVASSLARWIDAALHR